MKKMEPLFLEPKNFGAPELNTREGLAWMCEQARPGESVIDFLYLPPET